MRLLYTPVSREALDRLIAIARAERRRPQDQAAVLLERALRDDQPEGAAEPVAQGANDGAQ